MNRKKTFIVLGGAELPWIYPLGIALSKLRFTTLIRLGASFSLLRNQVEWPFQDNPDNFERVSWRYPPGFNRKFSFFFTNIIRKKLKQIIDYHYKLSGDFPFVITSYPNFFPYLQDVDPKGLVYLNYDDLSIDLGAGGYIFLPEEDVLAQQANTIVCSSHYQTVQFGNRFKNKKNSIFHLPHGVNELFIDPNPLRTVNRNTVCAVGALSSRYDWKLIHDVAIRLPDIRFLFIGKIGKTADSSQELEWVRWLNAALNLSNVQHIDGLLHRETPPYFWQSAVNWMPYKTELRFVRACCPLKLMDGIASGRPVISADVPECRLYPEWVRIYKTVDEAVALLTDAIKCTETQRYREKQMQFARNNTWIVRAKKLVEILHREEILN